MTSKNRKTVLLLGGTANGQNLEVGNSERSVIVDGAIYYIVPLCSHGEVFWFGVLDIKVCPVGLLVDQYQPVEAECTHGPWGHNAGYDVCLSCGHKEPNEVEL